jgi:GNAT superfamily N-acetyltransferase
MTASPPSVSASGAVPAGRFEIRRARAGDVAALPQVEHLAGLLFETCELDLGLSDEILGQVIAVETFTQAQQAGFLWVAAAGDRVIGFALVSDVGGYAHLDELDVLPEHGRRGAGSALVAAVCGWAKTGGYPAVTLRTFRDVPWNAPFYQRRGFRIVESVALSPGHVELEAHERERGLRTDLRVTMAFEIARG